jgi:exodeoxyribonuclease VII small subunit
MSEISYTDAFEELRAIVEEMETGEIGVDDLALRVKRASELIRICKKKLSHTEVDVKEVLKELEGAASSDADE